MTEPSHAVVYAAKSTEDKHGSIPTQIDDCEAVAERERWEVVGVEQDEAKSAFHGNRGPGLERAKALAVATAAEHGACVLLAQDADRFARGGGDAAGAADHLAEVFFAMRRQGVTLWTVRSGRLDTLRAVLEGERSHDESARKTQAVRAGLARRKASGKPVGALPLGYVAKAVIVDGEAKTRRVIDSATRSTVERIFSAIEGGATFGDVARALNAERVVGRRGKPWSSRTVRTIVLNAAYAGAKGYPMLIEPERWQAIQDGLRRIDPAAVQRRKGGRRPADSSYWLRGVGFCLDCGSSLYTRRQAAGRMYVCANRRTGTGLCHAEPIPAELFEGHVLDHLEAFVGDAQTWLAHQAQERDGERQQLLDAAQRLRDERDQVDQRRERLLDDYEALPSDDPGARLLLDRATRLDTERDALTAKIADGEAVASEWEKADHSDLAEAVDLLRALQDADTAQALNAALSRALAGIHTRITDGTLRAEFDLAPHPGTDHRGMMHLLHHAHPVGIEAERITLDDRRTGGAGPVKPGPSPRSTAA
jgi:DNA invertase Pin-like site-specific DNA recombinase